MVDKQAILDKIIQTGASSNLPDGFYELVLDRLESLSYKLADDDGWLISCTISRIENAIKNECNTNTIPSGLYYIAIDMICGYVLFSRKQTGQLEGFDVETAVKKVDIGDTSVSLANEKSLDERLDVLIAHLQNSGRSEFACYRGIKW